jgi:hypothetical protein
MIYNDAAGSTKVLDCAFLLPLLARIVARYRAQGTWPNDPRLDRLGYEYLQEILLSGGFIQNRHPYEMLIDTEIATEAMSGADP